ncbi:hypothetical protein FRB90_004412 [Tulasnella sp. 427]|nr:hypothetical protein FRB90_004412 [Tulasnella sp. 427]
MPLSILEPDPPSQAPPRLTLESLQHPFFQPSAEWPIRRLIDFVRYQKSQAEHYMRQGASYYQHWEDLIDQGANEDVRPSSPKKLSAFATPILQPRAARPVCTDVPRQEIPSYGSNADISKQEFSLKSIRDAPNITSVNENAPNNLQQSTVSKDARPEQTTGTKKSRAQVTADKNVKSATEPVGSHDEHEQRVAERRERRRAKREVVKAPPPPSSSESSSKSGYSSFGKDPPSSPGPVKSRSKRQERKNDKKRKSKILPGVALMEKFSAGNLGNERLTLKPSTAIGLFSKGRSSANGLADKAVALPVPARKASKGKKSKPLRTAADLMFSEFAFLKPSKSSTNDKKRAPLVSPAKSRRTKQRRQKKRIVTHEKTDSDKSTTLRSNASSTGSSSKAHTKRKRNSKPTRTDQEKTALKSAQRKTHKTRLGDDSSFAPKVQRPPPSDSHRSESSLPSLSNGARRKKAAVVQPPEGFRYLSPPWEIDGSLVGDVVPISEVGQVKARQPESRSGIPPSITSDKVVVVSGKWGLAAKGALENPGRPLDVDEAENFPSTKGTKRVPEPRSRFFFTPGLQAQGTAELADSTNIFSRPQFTPLPTAEPLRVPPNALGNQLPNFPKVRREEPIINSATAHISDIRDAARYEDYVQSSLADSCPPIGQAAIPENLSVSSRVASPDFCSEEQTLPVGPIAFNLGDELTLSQEHLRDGHMDFLRHYGNARTPLLHPNNLFRMEQNTYGFVPQEFDDDLRADDSEFPVLLPDAGEGDLECHHDGMADFWHLQDAFDDGDDGIDQTGDNLLIEADYAGRDTRQLPGSGDLNSPHEGEQDDVEFRLVGRRSMRLDGYGLVDDFIANRSESQFFPWAQYSDERTPYLKPYAHGEAGQEENAANDESEEPEPVLDTLGSNFKQGKALLLGIQQVHDGGTAEVDGDFARRLWRTSAC